MDGLDYYANTKPENLNSFSGLLAGFNLSAYVECKVCRRGATLLLVLDTGAALFCTLRLTSPSMTSRITGLVGVFTGLYRPRVERGWEQKRQKAEREPLSTSTR
jgi:hypothetical protein